MVHDDKIVEATLRRYRPVGPPAELRDRVLCSVGPRRLRWAFVGWTSLAAALVLSIGLYLATERVTRETAAAIGGGAPVWTTEADEAVELLNGHGSGRRYIAIALAAGQPRATRSLRPDVQASLVRDIQ